MTEITDAKIAMTDHPVHRLIKQRWSPRAFSARGVEPEKLQSLFEAARWAASSSNRQPWSYIVATKSDPAEFEKMVSCLREGNATWAEQAPVLMIAVANMAGRNDQPNRHAFYDTGAATASLSLQAIALDLYVHQMGGFFVDKAREVYQVPEDHEPVVAIALGYLGAVETLSEGQRERELQPRQRKPISEFVFEGTFGQPHSPLSAE